MSNSSDWGEMSEKRPADRGEREPERVHTHSESLEERQRANFSFVFVLCTDSGPIKTLLLATPDFLVLSPIRTLLQQHTELRQRSSF